MRHLAAYLLATISDDSAKPTDAKIQSILGSVGVEADETQLALIIEKFKNKSPATLIKDGKSLLASMPAAGAASGAAPAGDQGAAAPAAKEEKKEEKKEEPEEESDDDMGFGLFD